MSNAAKRKVFTLQWRENMSKARIGKRKENPLTPIHLSIRTCQKYKDWRDAIYYRDNFTCIWCGAGKDIQADHIIPFSKVMEKLRFEQGVDNLYEKAMNYKLLWNVGNGRTLCKPCHMKTDTYAGKSFKYKFNH